MMRFLAKKYNIEIQERELSEREKQVRSDRESMLIVNSWAQKYYDPILRTPGRQSRRPTLLCRTWFPEDTIRKFQLGQPPDQRDALV